MPQLIEKHKIGTRWTHWINFPVLGMMIWSGFLIYWANDVYRVGFGDLTVFKFFPESLYQALHSDHRLAEGMAIHFVFMWIFAINGLLYVLYTLVTGTWRELVPGKKSLAEAFQVVLYDLKLRKTLPEQGKYNAAQRITYSAIVLMGLGSLGTGLAIYRPTQVAWMTALFGGYELARIIHFALTIGYVLFFVVHLAQVAKAGWANFRSMVTGWDVAEPSKTEEVTGE